MWLKCYLMCVMLVCLQISGTTQKAPKTAVVHLSATASARGQVNEEKGARSVYIFYGLPYAEQPERFLPAKPLRLWKGEYAANNPGKVCKQYAAGTLDAIPYSITMEEYCLHLNIFTPTLEPNAKLDVMVWIYGGAFIRGAAVLYPSVLLPRRHNVVYVAINYRVGGLGFLTSGDDNAPGNVGLRDQVQALHWIRRYIRSFGGDPSKVTIFGESAGSMSVSFHLVSPMSKNLFRRAISESGVSTWANGVLDLGTAVQTTYLIAKQHGCPINSSRIMVQCLRKLPAKVFIDPRKYFSPVLDGTFLTDAPWNAYLLGKFHTKDYLLGFNSHEGYLLYRVFGPMLRSYGNPMPVDINNGTVKNILAGLVAFSYGRNQEITKRLIATYVGKDGDADKLHQDIVQATGDMWIVGPTVSTADKHSVKAKTYLYYYNYKSLTASKNRPAWVNADHSDEIWRVLGPFHQLFGQIPPSVENGDDKRLSLKMMSYWTNFAKTGNPNGPGLPHWPEYDCRKKRYMVLNKHPKFAANYKPALMKLWSSTIPALDRNHLYKLRPDQWKCRLWCKRCKRMVICRFILAILAKFRNRHICT